MNKTQILDLITATSARLETQGKPVGEIFWIETNALTSGARNQIDLVRRGIGDVLPEGSAAFFVPPTEDHSRQIALTVVWRSNAYLNNELKFAGATISSTSASWRILLNGLTDAGESLTPYARDEMQHKILLWFETGKYEYTLVGLDKGSEDETINALAQLGPTDQGRAGAAARGKWFGSIDPDLANSPAATDVTGHHSAESEDDIATTPVEVDVEQFNPADLADGRRRIQGSIVRRQGQKEFRRDVLAAYGGKCPVTGYDFGSTLEAAHIVPYKGPSTNATSNGILLRADIHTLFDLGLIGIDASAGQAKVVVHSSLVDGAYAELADKAINLPSAANADPSEALRWHLANTFLGST